jgi:hypothetical protein
MAATTRSKLSATLSRGNSSRVDVCRARPAALAPRLGQNRSDFFAYRGVRAAL